MSKRYLIIALDMGTTPPGTVFKTLVQSMKSQSQLDIVSTCFDDKMDWNGINRYHVLPRYEHSWYTTRKLWLYLHINHHDEIWTQRAFAQVFPLIKDNRYDAVLSFTAMNFFPAITLGGKIARKLGCKWFIYSVDGLPAPVEWLDGDTLIHGRIARWLDRQCAGADGFFSSNPYMAEYQKRTFPHCKGPWNYLLTPHLLDSTYPKVQHKGLVFLYTGSLYGLRRVDGLVHGFLEFRKTHPDAKLIFVGNIAIEYIRYMDEYTQDGLIEIHPFSKDLSSYFEKADVLIDIAADIPNDVYLSSKIISYLAVDRPILAISGANSPVRNLMADIPSIVHVANDALEICRGLETCVAAMGKGIADRDSVRKESSADHVAGRLLQAIDLPPKILISAQENVATTTGGSITVFNRFCKMLVQNGYEVYASCHSENRQTPSSLDERVRFINTRWHYPDESDFSKAFNRLVGDVTPQLLVFFFPHHYLAARLSKAYRNIPRILMFHSYPSYMFAQLERFEKRLKKYYLNTCAQILLSSHFEQLPSYMKKRPVVVIPNGIEQFRTQVNYDLERKRIIFFSRVDPMKGVDLLIGAFAIVASIYPDWVVDIYGDIEPEGYEQELRQLIHERSLEKNVFLKGVTSAKEETLTQYDFCLFPSRIEGLSLGLVESMSAGLACIGLESCPGVNELIIHGQNGLLCPDTAEGMAQAIFRLIEHPEERASMGRKAKVWAMQFAPEIIEMKWLSLIGQILDGDMQL